MFPKNLIRFELPYSFRDMKRVVFKTESDIKLKISFRNFFVIERNEWKKICTCEISLPVQVFSILRAKNNNNNR